jgi:hypothetical protein
VEHGEAEAFLFPGDGARDGRAAQRETSATGGVDVVGVAANLVAVEVGLVSKGREDGADGVVRGDLFKAELERRDFPAIELRAIAGDRVVRFCFGDALEEG